jgi:hypothetical protein
MYCTGGIRCEKASVYLKAKGFQNVFQLQVVLLSSLLVFLLFYSCSFIIHQLFFLFLHSFTCILMYPSTHLQTLTLIHIHTQGGIHRYLEEFPEGGHFKGKNFVFDGRVSVPAVTTSAVPGSSDDVINESADPSHTSYVNSLEHDNPEKITEVAANSSCIASDLESDPSSSMIVPDVVGRCVDCSCPYDRFSGLVVCTVCRLPVLVCDVCAEEKCYPGEYHCFRHRYRTAQ